MIQTTLIFLIIFFSIISNYANAGLSLADTNFKLAYWNDNIAMNKVFGIKIPEGNDDHFTANFMFSTLFRYNLKQFQSQWFFNIFTDKKQDFRTDLLSWIFSAFQPFGIRNLTLGTGFIANGHYNGDLIQNAYHRNFRHEIVDLPYNGQSKTGLTFLLKIEEKLIKHKFYSIEGYAETNIRSAIIPSLIKSGIGLNLNPLTSGKKYYIQFSIQPGYTYYLPSGVLLRDFFYPGFTWGAILAIGKIKSLGLELWVANNQQGMQQPHFGMTLSFPNQEAAPAKIGNYMYP